MITVFNGIVGRPHIPREPEVRDMIRTLGIELPEKPKQRGSSSSCSDEDSGADEMGDGCTEENAEEEPPTDDEDVAAECALLR